MTVMRAMVALVLCVAVSRIASAQSPDPHAGHTEPNVERRTPTPEQKTEPHAGHPGTTPDAESGKGGHIESAPPPESVIVPPWIADVTDEMRRGAFPDVHGHASHDQTINGFVLFDQLEWRAGHGPGSMAWSNTGWVGGDVNRLWFRTEGHGEDSRLEEARVHLLYGRAIARWWNVVGGIRQDLQPGAQTWLAVGVQGLAPGFFDIEATAYLSDEGQTAAHVGIGYDVLITNRLVMQPVVEMEMYGKPNASLGVASGISSGEAGLRLRYQFTREFAPYVGVSWQRAFGDTAHRDREVRVPNGAPRLVTGVRVWF